MKKPPLESAVVKDFRTLISALFPDSFTYKNHQTGFSGGGFPDLTVVVEGEVVFLEGKRGDEEPSATQEATLRELTYAGANAGLLRGGRVKGEFLLIPWGSGEDPEDVVTLVANGAMTKQELIAKWKEFVDACWHGARGGNPRVDGR